jgi:hypothetical protein
MFIGCNVCNSTEIENIDKVIFAMTYLSLKSVLQGTVLTLSTAAALECPLSNWLVFRNNVFHIKERSNI